MTNAVRSEKTDHDWELVSRFQGGDEHAFEELLHAYERRLILFFRRHGCRVDVAEDLSQDVFLRLLRQVGKIRPSGCFAGYLFRAAYNRFVDHLRRKRNERNYRAESRTCRDFHEDRESVRTDAPASLCARESTKALRLAVDTLPSHQRQTVWMAFMEEQPYQEISRQLGVPVGTVKSRLFNALLHLRRQANTWGYSA